MHSKSTIPMPLLLARLLVLPCLALSTPAVHAGDRVRWGSFGMGIGTGGLGVDYAYPLNSYIDLRGGYDFGSYKKRHTEDDGAAPPGAGAGA